MLERIKQIFLGRKIRKIAVESLKEENKELKEKVRVYEKLENTKRCPMCKQTKLKTDFAKNKTRKDGLQDECRECNKVMREKKNMKLQFEPSVKEFYGGYINITERYISYQRGGQEFMIIDVFRFEYLCKKFGRELVRNKIQSMIKYQNKNGLWKRDEDLFYRLRNWCSKEQIMENERNLFS